MRVIIACSGAGGHLSAGLAMARGLENKISNLDITFFISKHKAAEKLIKAKNYKFFEIYSKGLLNNRILGIISFLLSQFVGFMQSLWLLLLIRPNVVIGTGGYTSFNIVFLGWLFRINTVIHEQNIVPGKANLKLASIANKILLSFDGSAEYFKNKKCVFVGMPIRYTNRVDKKDALAELGLKTNKVTILVMGGSSGAHKINKLMINLLEKLNKNTVQFIHLTGDMDYKNVLEAYDKTGFSSYVRKFSYNMDTLYSSADLVISRAGSSSLSEIAYFKLPAIFIPYPYSKDNHQLRNAQYFEKSKAAFTIKQEEMNAEKVIDIIKELINKPTELNKMAENSYKLYKENAVNKIVSEIEEFLNV